MSPANAAPLGGQWGEVTVEASEDYRHMVYLARQHYRYCSSPERRYGLCGHTYQWLRVDAASIAYDLAVAEASRERMRQAVAW